MKIFISHSLKDKDLLNEITERSKIDGIEFLIAEHILEFDKTISQKIKNLIDQCDVGLILLTKNGLDSHFVGEEIGYLEAKGKLIIRVIEKGLHSQYSGFKFGSDFIELNPEDPNLAQQQLLEVLLRHKDVIESIRNAWVIAGIVILFLALTEKDEALTEEN